MNERNTLNKEHLTLTKVKASLNLHWLSLFEYMVSSNAQCHTMHSSSFKALFHTGISL